MEEPASWKGHSFTLLVFGGIVVLCSIFFVLGMLVGRSQGQRIAEIAMTEASLNQTQSGNPVTGQEFTFFKTVEADEEDPELPLEALPAAPELPPEPVMSEPAPALGSRIYLQVAALSQQKDAETELQKVKTKGFRSALILAPSAGSKDQLYRVQVGPYATEAQADHARKELESKGFKQVFLKK